MQDTLKHIFKVKSRKKEKEKERKRNNYVQESAEVRFQKNIYDDMSGNGEGYI